MNNPLKHTYCVCKYTYKYISAGWCDDDNDYDDVGDDDDGGGWSWDLLHLYFKACKSNGGLTEMSAGGDKIIDNVLQSLYGQI